MFYDWDLIVSSLAEQYGVRMYSREFSTVSWDEFTALLNGISPKTALGRIVSIRCENDKDMLKEFTPEMRKIRADWQKRMAGNKSQKQVDDFLEEMKNAFIEMSK